MSRRRCVRKQTVFTMITAAALSPLMIMSLSAAMPSAQDCIIAAADASARLAAGGFYSNVTVTEVSTEDKPAIQNTIPIDDSRMLSYGELRMPSSANEEAAVPEEHDEGAKPYPQELESRDGVIERMTYGFCGGTDYIALEGGGQVRNVTSVSRDTLVKASAEPYSFTVEKNGEPQVLIMHTHETESYEPYSRDFYDDSFTSRTTDDRMNMAAVGDAIAAQLESAGYGVLHDVTKHDYPSYNGSYDRSRVTVTDILEQYPSIKVVLDIHRDAIQRADGTRIAPVTEIDGKSAAQLMIICGCDDGTMNMPDYMENFRFACALQRQFETDFPTLTRPVLFDYRKYNQDLTTGSLLIEVGGHANSMDEAVYTGELIGKSLVNLFEKGM